MIAATSWNQEHKTRQNHEAGAQIFSFFGMSNAERLAKSAGLTNLYSLSFTSSIYSFFPDSQLLHQRFLFAYSKISSLAPAIAKPSCLATIRKPPSFPNFPVRLHLLTILLTAI